jgi:hypothetical protein
MNYINLILKIVILLLLFNQCADKYYLDEKYAYSYKSYGENVLAAMHEYYNNMFVYPSNIDNIIRYTYDKSMNEAALYGNSFYGIYGKLLTNLTKNCKYTQEEREKTFWGFAAFNFICMYKDYITINITNDTIIVCCTIDNRKIFEVGSFVQDKCYERYVSDGIMRVYHKCILLDSTEYTVSKHPDFRDSVINELRSIAKKYTKCITVHKEDRDYWKVIIVSYKRHSGLISLCPDDDIDLINDPYIIDVKKFLADLLNKNPDIYEIIIPLFCYENKKTK